MEKNYFLTYANSSLQDNPKHLKTFVSIIVYQEQHGEGVWPFKSRHLYFVYNISKSTNLSM